MFALTNHARKRLKQRFGISNFKTAVNFAYKAYKVGDIDVERDLSKYGFGTYVARNFEGNMFIYQNKLNDVVLITVYKKT